MFQDIGGSPTLFGVASVINHISEIFAYFFSFKLITQMGHVKVSAGEMVRRRGEGGQALTGGCGRCCVWGWLATCFGSCTSHG